MVHEHLSFIASCSDDERIRAVARELYMVGLIVTDMRKSVEFYRRLGVAIPEGSEENSFVAIKMTGMSFFLSSQPTLWDPHYGQRATQVTPATTGSFTHVLEFNLQERAVVDALYAELVHFGYQTYREPYQTPLGPYFALVYDPDGNTVLLSA